MNDSYKKVLKAAESFGKKKSYKTNEINPIKNPILRESFVYIPHQIVKKYKKVYIWKCQRCGQSIRRTTSNEPRRGCPVCGDKGAKSFVKERME